MRCLFLGFAVRGVVCVALRFWALRGGGGWLGGWFGGVVAKVVGGVGGGGWGGWLRVVGGGMVVGGGGGLMVGVVRGAGCCAAVFLDAVSSTPMCRMLKLRKLRNHLVLPPNIVTKSNTVPERCPPDPVPSGQSVLVPELLEHSGRGVGRVGFVLF